MVYDARRFFERPTRLWDTRFVAARVVIHDRDSKRTNGLASFNFREESLRAAQSWVTFNVPEPSAQETREQ
jgi:hypothetical protein